MLSSTQKHFRRLFARQLSWFIMFAVMVCWSTSRFSFLYHNFILDGAAKACHKIYWIFGILQVTTGAIHTKFEFKIWCKKKIDAQTATQSVQLCMLDLCRRPSNSNLSAILTIRNILGEGGNKIFSYRSVLKISSKIKDFWFTYELTKWDDLWLRIEDGPLQEEDEHMFIWQIVIS
jgi:hypothetical protein